MIIKREMRPEGLEPTTLWFEAKCSNPTELRTQKKLGLLYFLFLLLQESIKIKINVK